MNFANGRWLARSPGCLAGAAIVFLQLSLFASPVLGPRERISLDEDWRFIKGDPPGCFACLQYAPFATNAQTHTESSLSNAEGHTNEVGPLILKPWILPTGNPFIKDDQKRFTRPEGNPGDGIPYVQPGFDDSSWRRVNLPHDWAIEGPFTTKGGGGMGRLPSEGVGWYRKKLRIPAQDAGKSFFLDVDGAMSYSTVWLNGQLVGGWPYGYASWRVELTTYVKPGVENQLAVRLDNPPNSSRWYPGGGIYRNVWLVKTAPVHVAHWGIYVTTPEVSATSATLRLTVTVDNGLGHATEAAASTQIFSLDDNGRAVGPALAGIASVTLHIAAKESSSAEGSASLSNPKLWGPPPQQRPNRYVAVTTISQGAQVVDRYETPFGIRSLKFDPDKGFFINGEHVLLNGVCDHHDLGALGAALNYRALQRQLEMLQEMGCNAVRTSHNPPAPEFLELADKMGFLIMDEAFDVWLRRKTPFDFHLIFPDWHEQDLRAQLRRDRNCPSVILWSIGNEVGEQMTGTNGAALAKQLVNIVHEEDPTRPVTSAMNWAQPTNPLPEVLDVIGLNYQGAGIRGAPGRYPEFHEKFPSKLILGSETASALSSRGEYVFPVTNGYGAPVGSKSGEVVPLHQVSAYELYYAMFGASADKVFASQEQHPYVAGEFVWTGWDYLGEPIPFDSSRSSYSGIIDLAGFKKDRFFLYQAHWRPDFPMAHILPHWTWPERTGLVTPVHVFTSGDEGELFLNGKSLGRRKKGAYEYRLRWDDVVYQAGTLKVLTYKNGKEWATDTIKTAGNPTRLALAADRNQINSDGKDLAFVTVTMCDKDGQMAPRADNRIQFELEGPGQIVATDNGDPTSLESFQSHDCKAFNGLCLVIIRGDTGQTGTIKLTAKAGGLKPETTFVKSVVPPRQPNQI